MKFILETEDPTEELRQLANLLMNLRHSTKHWEEHYGALPRNTKKYWEKKADIWIADHVKEVDE